MDLDVAIIGFTGRFPGAKNIEDFWENLRLGVESISFFDDEELHESGLNSEILNDPNYVKAAPILEDIDKFDAQLFDYTPREARLIDPQQRIFLECAWEALEVAGYDPAKYGNLIAVYAGATISTYFLFNGLLQQNQEDYFLAVLGNDKDFLSTRVSYKLNLTGPSVTIQSACSTSLVAIHMACQSLLNRECDMALAGGVSIRVPQKTGYFYHEGGILSPDGHCRTFDSKAKGTVFGSGAGLVVLKRLVDALADGDSIHAVIKGSAINNDGSSKVEFTAPSVVGQSDAMVEALSHAGVEAETLSYIEAHGTGTLLGDPIEIAALTRAFRAFTSKKGFCGIGSVKTNIGHMDVASGVAGLIKTILALKHRQIPPSLHYVSPNPEIDFDNSPFYVNTFLTEWDTGSLPRRAGINSLGMGGTNAFVILEEAPAVEGSGKSRPYQLIQISAKTESALEAATEQLANYLTRYPNVSLADVAYTLQVGRKDLEYRRMVICRNTTDAISLLKTLDGKRVLTSYQKPIMRDVVFMFTGQGAQYVNMGLELYQTEPEFRIHLDHCCKILQSFISMDLRDILYPDKANLEQAAWKLNQTDITQLALFTIEYAIAQLWISWGILPTAFIGHSIGEYVAACLSGVFCLEDALCLVAIRASLMQGLPNGSMLALPLSEQEIQPFLNEKISLAAVNGPSLCVVSGEKQAIKYLERQLAQKNLNGRLLQTSHAFHSAMMEPILNTFRQRINQINRNAPKIPFISNVTGTWITSDEAIDPGYWARHMRQTVYFSEGIQELLKIPNCILLEVGPGRTLSTLAKQYVQETADQVVLASLHHPHDTWSDVASLLNTLGKLWLSGIPINWTGFYTHERRYRLPLPTYPFQRQRYWVETTQTLTHTLGKSSTSKIEYIPLLQDRQTNREDVRGSHNRVLPVNQTMFTVNKHDSVASKRVGKTDVAYMPPRTPVEGAIAIIWQKVLGIEQVGIHDDFFQLGGHSILISQVMSRLNQTFQVDLPILTLLESPTVVGLAQCIEAVYRLEQNLPISPSPGDSH